MLNLFLALVVSVASYARPAKTTRGFVEVAAGRRLYVEYRPALNGKPTVFLLNGLTYSTREWAAFAQALTRLDPEIGLVLYDMQGMGATLLANLPVLYDIPVQNQVEDLHALKRALKISGPTASVGLSYGGAVALMYALRYPGDFDQTIAMAPFLERLPDQDHLILQSVRNHRLMFPLDPRSDEELYDLYLRGVVATFPLVEPVILENPFKLEGVYRMVKGAKNWNAAGEAAKLPAGQIHIVAATGDEYVKLDRMQNFLNHVPSGVLESVLFIEDPSAEILLPSQKYHKIPELRPTLSAAWVHEIVSGNRHLQKGRIFNVDPQTGEARSGKIKIPLKREKKNDCETALARVRRAL